MVRIDLNMDPHSWLTFWTCPEGIALWADNSMFIGTLACRTASDDTAAADGISLFLSLYMHLFLQSSQSYGTRPNVIYFPVISPFPVMFLPPLILDLRKEAVK